MDASEKKKKRVFDFLGKRNIFGAISALLVLASVVLLVVPGPNYGIDFAGGTNIIGSFSAEVTDEEVREALRDAGYQDAAVQAFGPESDGKIKYLVRTETISTIDEARVDDIRQGLKSEYGDELTVEFDKASGDRFYVRLPVAAYLDEGQDPETAEVSLNEYASQSDGQAEQLRSDISGIDTELKDISVEPWGNPTDRRFVVGVETLQSAVESQLGQAFGQQFNEIERIESVGPRVGEQLRNDSIKAVLIALLMILLYIAIRFDVRYAPGAVVALFHDVLITLGIFVVIQQEISLPIVAALLTIVGYSLNDTIVNFDRIRENVQLSGGKGNLVKLVNRSLNECLSRTLLTSITTLVALLAIYFLGGGLIKSFALAMIIGVLIGTYSSIYVASPVMIWTSKELDKRERRDSSSRRRKATAES
jgi:preprotein translocase subunit SecF